MISPFTIASSKLEKVENVATRVELSNGAVGWGEAPILPFVTAEDQHTAMVKASEAYDFLLKCPALTLGSMLGKIGDILPGHQFASVRAGVEMAVIDAVTNSIPEAAELASKYYKQGFKTLKLKVGKNLKADIEVLQAIRVARTNPSLYKSRKTEDDYNKQSISLVVVSNEINVEVAMKQDDAVLNCASETSEAFFSNLSSRIQQGVESNTIDLLALSERLVNSSIYWLCKKVDRETIPQIDSHMNDNKACGSVIVSELIKLLLKDPKEIAAKHKSRNLFSQLSDAAGPATIITEHAVREYELQILFRMEILPLEVAVRSFMILRPRFHHPSGGASSATAHQTAATTSSLSTGSGLSLFSTPTSTPSLFGDSTPLFSSTPAASSLFSTPFASVHHVALTNRCKLILHLQ
ncbi:hypothetical protein KIW84_030442 [Lathyrus oleraceus]|uniref:Uncharacterized protein n=1 Tax=Pisum sativum TaxID=3888 RepID=A0A9D5AW77_PEA|nr:hypothetical protein KIW84_030442 [Pisum sativum]